jgi:hypothetical protein
MSKRRIVITVSVLAAVGLVLYTAHSMDLVGLLIKMHGG